jgi:hypothetical protein
VIILLFLITGCVPDDYPTLVLSTSPNESSDSIVEESLERGELIVNGDSRDDATQQANNPQAVIRAVNDLAKTLGISDNVIEIVNIEQVNWPDSCLGFSSTNHSCLQVITPGYRVILRFDGKDYEYHTDETGLNLQIDSGSITSGLKPGFNLDKSQVLLKSMRFLTELKGIQLSDIKIISIDEVDFPDSCLGLRQVNEVCADSNVLGWEIILSIGEEIFELHSDSNGENIRLK